MDNFINKLDNLKTSLTFDDVLIKPNMSSIMPGDVDISVRLNNNLKLDIPILSAAMDTVTEYEMAKMMIVMGGIAPLHKNLKITDVIEITKKLKKEFGENKPYAVAIGVDNTMEEIDSLIQAGANVLVVDSAHGHSHNVGTLVEQISTKYPDIFLIAGNVVTPEGAQYLIDRGAKAVKVGIGPGSICITRKVTGIGVGQLTAIADVAVVCKKNKVLSIADGGVREPDEIMKALTAGADMVMLGYMLAGTDECPGKTVIVNEQNYKLYRGMGSINAMKEGSASRYNKKPSDTDTWINEGVESYIKIRGSVKPILNHITWGLKTAFGYVGASNIETLHKTATFIRITKSVLKKSDFHSVDKVIKIKQ